jgi:hypothetical protein
MISVWYIYICWLLGNIILHVHLLYNVNLEEI